MTNFIEKARDGRRNALNGRSNGHHGYPFVPRNRTHQGHIPVVFSSVRGRMGADTILT